MTETSCSTRRRDPSPAEIAAECREIQATWTDDEKLKRLRVDLRPYFRRCDGVYEEFSATDYETHHSERERLQELTS